MKTLIHCILLIIIPIIRSDGNELEVSGAVDYLKLMSQNNQIIDSECKKVSDAILNVAPIFYKMGNAVSLQCQIHLQMDVLNLKKLFDNYIEHNLQNYLKNIDGLRSALMDIQSQSTIETTSTQQQECSSEQNNDAMIISAIRRRDFCLAHQLLKNGTIRLSDIVLNVYNKNLKYAESLVEFLNSVDNIQDKILSYRLLFDNMKENMHEYSTVTTTIAYQVMNILIKTFAHNENFIHLKNNLPKSLQQFPWTSTLNIKNLKFSDEVVLNSGMYDDTKRNVVMYYHFSTCGADCHWTLIPVDNGAYFIIKNNHYNHILFGDRTDFDVKNRRRIVYTYPMKKLYDTGDTGRWQLEPIKGTGYFQIKNIKWNEYLYVEDGFQNLNRTTSKQVFTSVHGLRDYDYSKWEILKK